jgi:hypothetical protein
LLLAKGNLAREKFPPSDWRDELVMVDEVLAPRRPADDEDDTDRELEDEEVLPV